MEGYQFYHYTPSKAGAIISILCFTASTCFHIYQLMKLKSYFFTTFIVGAIMMSIGYICRAISASDTTALGPFIIQNICILLPPSLYAATIYMIYGRIVIYAREPRLSLISPYKVTKIFVVGDAIAFLTQASGGGMMAISSMADMGQKTTIVGLFVQLAFFGFFLTVTLTFERRLNKHKVKPMLLPFGPLLYILLGVSALIILRCLYRVVEFCQGNDGYLMSHEAYMYILDTIPMFVVQVIFHFFHPGKILDRKRDEHVEMAFENMG